MQLMDCIQAISLTDGRELFQMIIPNQIMNSQGEMCISAKGKKVVVAACGPTPPNSWLIDHQQKIRPKGDTMSCLTVMTGGEYDNYAIGAEVETTSISSDNNHPSTKITDGSDQTYW